MEKGRGKSQVHNDPLVCQAFCGAFCKIYRIGEWILNVSIGVQTVHVMIYDTELKYVFIRCVYNIERKSALSLSATLSAFFMDMLNEWCSGVYFSNICISCLNLTQHRSKHIHSLKGKVQYDLRSLEINVVTWTQRAICVIVCKKMSLCPIAVKFGENMYII